MAQEKWSAQAPNLFKEHTVEISASSAGRCITEMWAYLHDALDLPENHATELCKMDGGTLYGARAASLFAAGWEALHPEHTVWVEVVGEHDGIPAHVEIIVRERGGLGRNLWVIEVKTSFWTGEWSGPPEYHKIQSAKEALVAEVPGFSIFTLLPGAQRRKGAEPRFNAQDDFVTADWTQAVSAEYRRLKAARSPNPPPTDVREAWRCSSCRYSRCPKNVNPLKEALCPL